MRRVSRNHNLAQVVILAAISLLPPLYCNAGVKTPSVDVLSLWGHGDAYKGVEKRFEVPTGYKTSGTAVLYLPEETNETKQHIRKTYSLTKARDY